jgi:Ca2+-binding RTX toxin-like protein
LYGIDNVIGTEGADTIRGNGSPNVLTGGDRYDDGTDVIFGLGGADTLLGRAGNDVLDGGRGHNSIDGGPGSDTCVNPAAGPTVTGCEQPGS